LGEKSSLLLTLVLCAALGSVLVFKAEATEAQIPEQRPLWSYKSWGSITSVAISSDAQYLVAGDYGFHVNFFSCDNNTPFWSYFAKWNVYSVSISSDGNYAVAGSLDKNVYLFSRSNGTPCWSYSTNGNVYSASISSDGNYIVAGSWDNKVYLFSSSENTPRWSYSTNNNVYSVSISSDGSYIAAGSLDKKVYLFNRNNQNPLWSYQAENEIYSVAISSDSNYVAAGSSDNKVYLFSRSDNTPLWSYQTNGDIWSVSISSDGNYVAAGSGDHKVYLFSRSSNTPLWNYQTDGGVWSVSISSDGSYVAAGSWDRKVYFFSRSDGTPLWSYTAGNWIASVSVSSDGSYVAAGSADSKVYLFPRACASGTTLTEPTLTGTLIWLAAVILVCCVVGAVFVKMKRRHKPKELLALPLRMLGRKRAWRGIFVFILVIGIVSASLVIYYETRESRTEQMTTEQVMKMLPQSVPWFTYGDLQTMREIAEIQEWYNDITSRYLSQGLIDPNSIDYIIDAGSYLEILGGKFDFEKIRKAYENYTIEEYKGYQILRPWSSGTVFAGGKNVVSFVIVLTEDKIVMGQIDVVKEFIDVAKGDKASMYENSAYDNVKSEITGGFIIRIGKSILSRYGEKILGYCVNQGDPFTINNITINMARVKAVYVYDNQSAAEAVLENLENDVIKYWHPSESTIEQKGKAIVITITHAMQNVEDLIRWIVGTAGVAEQITFQNSVSWSAVRDNNGDIAVSYHDKTGNTLSANVKIENLTGQIENETNFENTSTFSFTWGEAENSVTYRVILTINHNIFGEVSENKLV